MKKGNKAIKSGKQSQKFEKKIGASEGIRTLDVHLGKVMLYQTELRSRSARTWKKLGQRPSIARTHFHFLK